MYKVLIYGAGSIGNHLAYACRQKEWNVDMFDVDSQALVRTREQIYPDRYGFWDDSINLLNDVDRSQVYDLVIIGTPPDTHMQIALDVISGSPPKVLLIEKPLCTPLLENLEQFERQVEEVNCEVLIAYNHNLTSNTSEALQLVKTGLIGIPRSIHVRWLEHWGGIFQAHPWLDGPSDTYLGFSQRGGGACAEHSHAISLWQLFASELGLGQVQSVFAMMDIDNEGGVDYDRTAQLTLRTTTGFTGTVIQDVVTEPAEKALRIQGDGGYLEWYVNYDTHYDALIYSRKDEEPTTRLFPKARPDDFKSQIDYIGDLLMGQAVQSRNTLSFGVETMRIVSAAHKSNEQSSVISI